MAAARLAISAGDDNAARRGELSVANYKYLMLAEKLKNEILSSLPPPGKKLPTEDDLMARHSMSRNTVRQAVTLLA